MIVGVGEILWDVFADGRKVAGGAPFNFAAHCRQLGHPAAVVTRVGDDELGRELRAEIRRLRVSDEFVQVDKKRPTGTVKVAVDGAGQPTYTFAANPAWHAIEWTTAVADLGRRATAVCHGTLPLQYTSRKAAMNLLTRVGAHGLSVYDVNLRGGRVDERAFSAAKWVKMNEAELDGPDGACEVLSAATEERLGDAADLLRVRAREQHKPDGGVLIVTRGADGAEVVSAGGTVRVRAVPATVVDTVGAGDAFTAAMVCLHLEGQPLDRCAKFASHYAARVCEYRGATPVIDRAEVERAAFGL